MWKCCEYNVSLCSKDTVLLILKKKNWWEKKKKTASFFSQLFRVCLLGGFFFSKQYKNCKDKIWLESKTGMDPGPRSSNNEFIECRKES